MKRIINLLLILAFLGLSGCWTKIYLSEQEREQESILKDDEPPLLKAIKPTIISPGGTWGTVRSIINTNFSNINGTLDSIEHNIDVHDDSLTAHRIAINLRLLKSDTASMLQRYARQSALNTALAGKQNTLVSGTNIKTINNQSILGTGNIEITGGGETMIYPSAGIPTSTGSAWGTSITNNSTNWDTAYSERLRWDGSSTGLNAATARTSLGLNNVTNESKATMFTNPTFTGTVVRWGTDTLATRAEVRVGRGLTAQQVGEQIGDSIRTGVQLGDVALLLSDTSRMLAPYARRSELGSSLFIFGLGSGHISDTALFNNGRIAGAFYHPGPDTLYVTEVRGVLTEGTGTETITCDVVWDVNMRDATPTHLVATGLTVTSTTTGTVLTSFSNNMILPNRWVWCPLSGASANNKPTMLILQLTGYKRNRSN